MKDKIRVKFLRYKNIVLAEVITLPEKYKDIYLLLRDKETDYQLVMGESPELRGELFFLCPPNKNMNMSDVATYRYFDENMAKHAVETFTRLIHEVNVRDEEKDYTTVDMRGMETTLAD